MIAPDQAGVAGARVRATDDELPELEPIIDVLLAMLCPITHSAFRLSLANGARVRILTVQEVDVDIIALARFVRDRSRAGAGAKVIDL